MDEFSCEDLINKYLSILRQKYDNKYLNKLLMIESLFKNNNHAEIDSYIKSMTNFDTKMPTAKLITSGHINKYSDTNRYIRNFTNYDFNKLESGYFYLLRLSTENQIGYNKYYKCVFYEIIIMKLDNGEIWALTEDYDFFLVTAGYGSFELNFNDYLPNYSYIGGSVEKMGYDNITDYINIFIRLGSFLNLNNKYECPKFISLIENFNTILEEDIDKYEKFYNYKTLALVTELVGETTHRISQKSQISKIHRTSKLHGIYGKIRSNNLKGIYKILPNYMLKILESSAYLDNYEDLFYIFDYVKDYQDFDNFPDIFYTFGYDENTNITTLRNLVYLAAYYIYYNYEGDDHLDNEIFIFDSNNMTEILENGGYSSFKQRIINVDTMYSDYFDNGSTPLSDYGTKLITEMYMIPHLMSSVGIIKLDIVDTCVGISYDTEELYYLFDIIIDYNVRIRQTLIEMNDFMYIIEFDLMKYKHSEHFNRFIEFTALFIAKRIEIHGLDHFHTNPLWNINSEFDLQELDHDVLQNLRDVFNWIKLRYNVIETMEIVEGYAELL